MPEETYTTVCEAVSAFDRYLAPRRSRGTRIKYAQHLRHFAEWAGDRAPGAITAWEVEMTYLAGWQLQAGRTLSAATRRNRITALNAFYSFLERLELLGAGTNPMKRVDRPTVEKRVHDWLQEREDCDVLDSARTPFERALVYTLRYTGLRVSEAIALTWGREGVDLTEETVKVTKSKTPKGRRIVPIFAELLPILKAWREFLEGEGLYREGGAVFPILKRAACNRGSKRPGDAISPQYAHRVVQRVGKRAGVPMLGPHALRRTFASRLINDDPSMLPVISRLLGHSSTKITEESYAELLDETVARQILGLVAA